MPQAATATAPMTVTVVLPPVLMTLFPDAERRAVLRAATVAEMLDELDARWPGMRDRLRDSTPRIRRHINVFVEGRRASLDTPLPAGATIYVLTAMSGG
jgi:molybdopterin converting factor small subunit